MDKRLSEQTLNLQSLLSELPSNFTIQDCFTKAHSLICTDKFEKIICSVSGGSDSDLIVDILSRLQQDNIEYYYFDTGMEYKATKEHLDYLERRYGIQIERVKVKCPVPLACKKVGQPFLSKQVSEYISRLQRYDFKWEDRPYEELLKEYPNCASALKWWCNYKDGENNSMFNINRNKWLKEFIVENPPTFSISNKCCDLAKKAEGKKHISNRTLTVIGVRKAEGGSRAGHNTCTTFGQRNVYRPIFWFLQDDKEEYEQFADIKHSKCYTEYGLPRTGCAGCPFGKNFEFELEVMRKYEPGLYKAACNIFKESYEYTRRYKEYCKRKDAELKKQKIGYQTTIFDFME